MNRDNFIGRGTGVGLVLLLAIAGGGHAAAQPAPPGEVRVTFSKGATSTTIKGQLTGRADVDYLVRGAAGQTLTISLQRPNPSNSFNVISPGNRDAAMFVGDSADHFTARLPADGDYRIRVYLNRAAARRPNASAAYTLTVGITGQALAPREKSQDALLPGTSYHAAASISCVPNPYVDTQLKPCQAFVIRRAQEAATVEIPLGEAWRRHILFEHGKPVAADAPGVFSTTREGDVSIVRFDSGEVYRIPDAFVIGG